MTDRWPGAPPTSSWSCSRRLTSASESVLNPRAGLNVSCLFVCWRYVPTVDDVEMYKSHQGPVTELHIVDQYMMEVLLFIPNITSNSQIDTSSLVLPHGDRSRMESGSLSLHWPAFSPTRCGCHREIFAFIWLSPSSTPGSHLTHVSSARGCRRGDRWSGGSAYGGFQEYFTPDAGILYARNKVASCSSRGSCLLVNVQPNQSGLMLQTEAGVWMQHLTETETASVKTPARRPLQLSFFCFFSPPKIQFTVIPLKPIEILESWLKLSLWIIIVTWTQMCPPQIDLAAFRIINKGWITQASDLF